MKNINLLGVSPKEAAKQLGISPGLCYQQIRYGLIPAVHIGRRIIIPIAMLHALLYGQKEGVSICPDGNGKPPTAMAPSTVVQTDDGEPPSG